MESTVNESMNESFTETYQQISPYATYFKMSVLFLGTPTVIITASFIIYIIMKNERLQTKNNYFLINLLVSDIILVFTNCSIHGILIILYQFDIDIDAHCFTIIMLTLIPVLANKLCFLPVVVDRLLFVALPFDYKLVVTNKVVTITISTLWLVAVCLTVVIVTTTALMYVPPLGDCTSTQSSHLLLQIATAGPQLITVLVVIITSIYFRYKIYKSNKFFKRTYTNTVEKRKAISAGILLDKLWKEVKPTVTVLIVGGVDGLFNLLVPVIWASGRLVFTEDPYLRRTYTLEIVLLLQLCQALSHSLTYGIHNRDIRKYLHEYKKKIFMKRSKVITLRRELQ